MKILALADEESAYLWDYYRKEKLEGIDLILSAGDLKASYLSFLATMAHCPVLYVPGNHDQDYLRKPPEGCICVDDKLYEYMGVRILGLGGSAMYNGGPYQYTQNEMNWRVMKLAPRLIIKNGFDILLTHAPAAGMGDQEDPAHKGFEAFPKLMDYYKPKLMVHGHVHMSYGHDVKRESMYHDTRILNAYERYIIEI